MGSVFDSWSSRSATVNFIVGWMRGACARAWGAGWKDDLTRALAVEIPGQG